MNRRGHLSHKVPNVKLRPAPPPGATRSRGKAADRDGSPFRSMMDEEILRQAMEGEEGGCRCRSYLHRLVERADPSMRRYAQGKADFR